MKKKLLALLMAGSMLAATTLFGSCAVLEDLGISDILANLGIPGFTQTSSPEESSPEEEVMPYDTFKGSTFVMGMDISLDLTLAEDGTYAITCPTMAQLNGIFANAGGTYTYAEGVYTLTSGEKTFTSAEIAGQLVISGYEIVGPEATIIVNFAAGEATGVPYATMTGSTFVMGMDIALELAFAEDGTYAITCPTMAQLNGIFANAGGTYSYNAGVYTLLSGEKTFKSVTIAGQCVISGYEIVGPEATIIVNFAAGEATGIPCNTFKGSTFVMGMDIELVLTLAEDGSYAITCPAMEMLNSIFANAGGTYGYNAGAFTLISGETTYTSTYANGAFTIAEYTIVGPEATIVVNFVSANA